MYATTTKIETHDGHRYAVVRTADGREIRRSACDGDTRPDGTVVSYHNPPPPLSDAVGKTVATVADGWSGEDGLPDNQVRIVFTDGSRLLFVAGGAYELSYEWETDDR